MTHTNWYGTDTDRYVTSYDRKSLTPRANRGILLFIMHKYGDTREDGKVFVAYGTHYKGGEYWVTREKFEERQERRREYYNDPKRRRQNRLARKLRHKERMENDPEYRENRQAKERERMAKYRQTDSYKVRNKERMQEARQRDSGVRGSGKRLQKGDIAPDGRVVLLLSGRHPVLVTAEEFIEKNGRLPKKPFRPLKRGDVRDDGKVFWRYKENYKNGEMWVTPERFRELAATEKRPVSAAKRREYNRRYATKKLLREAGC